MGATTAAYVYHVFASMLLAVHGRFATEDVEARLLHARVVGTTPAAHVHHADIGMFFAVHGCLAAGEVEL